MSLVEQTQLITTFVVVMIQDESCFSFLFFFNEDNFFMKRKNIRWDIFLYEYLLCTLLFNFVSWVYESHNFIYSYMLSLYLAIVVTNYLTLSTWWCCDGLTGMYRVTWGKAMFHDPLWVFLWIDTESDIKVAEAH